MSTTPRKRLLATVCLVALAVTAGCSFLGDGSPSTASPSAATDAAPTATAAAPTTTDRSAPQATATPTDAGADGTATAGPSDSVTVNGNLSVNATRVFERVERLHGVDVDAPAVSVVEYESRQIELFRAPFYRAFGVTGNVTTAGQARRDGSVYLDAAAEHPEMVLAHEFAHHVHLQQRWWPTGLSSVPDDEQRAAGSVTEGAAVYATDAYVAEYDTDAIRNTREMSVDYGNGNAAFRLTSSPYLAGAAYVDSQVATPEELEPVLSDPPETTEQILHPDRSVSLGNLTVSTNTATSWTVRSGHYPSDADRRGELLVRELLRLELDREVADAAADGWDNDRSLTFESTTDESTGVAWALRFENATEADEFAAAFDRFAERRNESVSGGFAAERVAPEAVTVFAGSDAFVEGASASGTNESVRVAAPGADATEPAEAVRPPSSQSTSRHPTTPQSANP